MKLKVLFIAVFLLAASCAKKNALPSKAQVSPQTNVNVNLNEASESELLNHIGEKVTMHGKWSLRGKIGPTWLPADTRSQIPLADGTTANPEVVLFDEKGTAYELHPSKFLSTGIGYGPTSMLPRHTCFTKVKIRNDKPFRASNIYWENYNLK
jgi:hypothetical protein